ncbi:hypothetical protein [Bartonella apis]|uniref:hypothetical protein n=1 Tax=Bartonella apis TaxID=1686310 RepID=UPI0009675394|nr:hypothetical protein [Bartonella apis]OLY46943.1 Phage-related baseplate assembly protein [Bartonella apis]
MAVPPVQHQIVAASKRRVRPTVFINGRPTARIGHEVIVDFLEGDPDQLIIIGRTYHETNMPAYDLPNDKNRMVIRSNTHKNGPGVPGFNELSFEDEKRTEELHLRT